MTQYIRVYPYAGDGWPYTGPSIGGMLATAFMALAAVGILAAFFSFPLAW